MPKGPRGEKRPADTIGNAMKVMRVATGEEVDERTDDGKDAAAVSLARHGRVDRGQDQIAFVEQRAQVSSLVALRGIERQLGQEPLARDILFGDGRNADGAITHRRPHELCGDYYY